MIKIAKLLWLVLPFMLILNCWDETTNPDEKIVEPITIAAIAVKDSLGTVFITPNDSTATPEKPKSLYVKTLDLDFIDSIGAVFYTGQNLDIGERICISSDNISDSVFSIGALTFTNTGLYKVFYFAKIIDSTNETFIDTITFVVGGVAPMITANELSNTIFTVKELTTLEITFKANGQYSSSKPYFLSSSDIPTGAAFDSTTGIFTYTPDTSIAIKDSSITLSNIIITAVDNSNPPVISTYSFDIIVKDSTEDDIIDSIGPIIIIAGSNPDTLYVNESYTYPTVTATDNIEGDISSKITTIGTVDSSVLGEQLIYYVVSDSSGNSSYDTLRINVIDTTPPVISLVGLGSDTVLLGGGAYSDPGATALDNADGLITFDKFTVTGTVNKDSLGTYSRTYNVADVSGNMAIPVTRTVIVIDAPDTTAPIVMINGGDKNDTVWVGDSYTLPIAMASDNKDGMIANDQIIKTPSTVSTDNAGTFKFIYSATDQAGNTGTDTLTLMVKADTIAPVITILGNVTDTINVGDSYILPSAIAIDNKDDTVDVLISGTVNNTVAGSNIITYTSTDAAGNESSKLVIIKVNDIAPTITSFTNDLSIKIEKSCTLTVAATGTNLKYQWYKNGQKISGALSDEYVISSVLKVDTNTSYSCEVSNTEDTVSTSGINVRPLWVVKAEAGKNCSFIILSDSTLWACGYNSGLSYSFGIDTSAFNTFTKIMENVIDVETGADWMTSDPTEIYTMILKSDNTLWASRSIKGTTFNNSNDPISIEQVMTNIIRIDAGMFGKVLIQKADSSLWSGESKSIINPNISGGIKTFYVGGSHSAILNNNDDLYVQGSNYYGQLGVKESTSVTNFRMIITGVKSVALGFRHTFILLNDGTLKGCGYNEDWELGLGVDTNINEFTEVLTEVREVYSSAFSKNTIALKNDGTIWGFGNNQFGLLGNGTSETKKTPTQMIIDGNVSSISIGKSHTLIIKEDGTLWACGSITSALGNTVSNNSYIPIKVNF